MIDFQLGMRSLSSSFSISSHWSRILTVITTYRLLSEFISWWPERGTRTPRIRVYDVRLLTISFYHKLSIENRISRREIWNTKFQTFLNLIRLQINHKIANVCHICTDHCDCFEVAETVDRFGLFWDIQSQNSLEWSELFNNLNIPFPRLF